jgi:formylglycine-generating enzyme required for sulfatase activity
LKAAALLVVLVGCAPPEEPQARAEATTDECAAPRDPALVLAGRSGSTCLAIDRHEVTQRAYEDFLARATHPAVPGCDWNEDLQPDAACLARPEVVQADDRPAVCLDVCDAASFCVAAGKHLCAGDPSATEAKDQSDWVRACTNDGRTTQFPYPGDGVDGRCNVDSTAATPPGAYATCTSMSGAMDLSGNVAEWTLPCEGAGPDAVCPARGGSFLDTDIASARCASQVFLPANARSSYVGFRCCGDNL